uniref:J domain-containing protein n=1 Tax=viral metagenome TaxID=1070528 RepID=A0A6C0DE61_9ZZZZ
MAEEDDPHRVYEKVVDIGGDCYFLEDDQTSLKMGCKSYVEFKKTFDPKLYNRSLKDIEYIFGRYLAFGNHQLDTFHGDDKDNLIQLLTTRIKQLKESNEYSSSRIINSRMKTYVDNIYAILAKLGEGEVVPNNVGEADTFSDEELYQFILELTWFLTHADKVPKQNRKLWNEMVKKMRDIGLGTIAQQIRQNNSANSKPPAAANFFSGINTTQMKEAKTLRQAVGESDDTLRPKFQSLITLLRLKGYLGQSNSYNVSMQNDLTSKMLNQRVVQGPRARTGVRRPASAPASSKAKRPSVSVPPVLESDSESESNASIRKKPKAAKTSSSSTSSNLLHDTDSDDDINDATGAAAPAAASSQVVVAPASSTSQLVAAPAANSIAAVNPFPINRRPVSSTFSFQQGGESNTTESLKNDTITTDTLYQLTSPLFDYVRVLFDPIYSILQRPEFEMDIALITIIPLLHACMNIKLPGIYRILNIDPDVKTCIDKMLGATQEFISNLTKSEHKKQFLEQLKKLPRMHLTSLIGPSSNSNHYKDPSTFPAIQFLSLGVNFTVKEEATNVPDGFFNESNLYLSNTPETSTTDKLKGMFSSNLNKKIKLYTLDWNTIKASKASLDLQNDKKEINLGSLDINPEVLFTDSELFLKTIMIVHHIFPGKNTFTPIEQPKEEPKPKAEPEPKEEEPKEEPKEEEESKEESTCKEELVAKECEGTPSERKKQYRKQTVVLHPDKHMTDGCKKEAENAFKDLQSKKSCTETNENTVAPNTVPQTNAPLALTTNAVVVPTNAVPQTNAATTTNTTVVAPATNTTAIVVSK